uniref:G_PROTEIN_RECEP_F1_2 domain-containing protein n=1 Tax=Heterorhabditis bacteriophora TaxID=37862 RepID=A0A1I7X8T1_HETBA
MANHSFQYYPNPTVTAVVGSWNIESYDDDDAWIFTKVLMTFIYSILTIIGIVGNLLVILVVLKFRGMYHSSLNSRY